MLKLFQYHNTRALTHYEARTIFIKRPGGLRRILVQGTQRLHGVKSAKP